MTYRTPPIRRTAVALSLASALTLSLMACSPSTDTSPPSSTTRTGSTETVGNRSGTLAKAAEKAEKAADKAAAKRLGALADASVTAGTPGVIVRVDDGDGPVIEVVRQAPWSTQDGTLDADDTFRVGSNTKTMIAALVLQETAAGTLDLADPIETYLPGRIPNGKNITVKMLLNHTSGLGDYFLTAEGLTALTGHAEAPLSPEALLDLGAAQEPVGTPGGNHSYSNTNYIALGLLLEATTGTALPELITERITGPLKMRSTYFDTGTTGAASEELATGYEPDAEHLAPLLPEGSPEGISFNGTEHDDHVIAKGIDPSWTWAAGAMVSTAADWAQFDRALLSGRFLPAAQLEQMRTMVPADPSKPDGSQYGLGLQKVVNDGGTVWGHSGGIPGYASELYADSTGTRTVAILTPTLFGLRTPAATTADKNLVEEAIRTMLD